MSIPFRTAVSTALSVAGALGSGPDFAMLVISARMAYMFTAQFACIGPTQIPSCISSHVNSISLTFRHVAAALSFPFIAAFNPFRSWTSRSDCPAANRRADAWKLTEPTNGRSDDRPIAERTVLVDAIKDIAQVGT